MLGVSCALPTEEPPHNASPGRARETSPVLVRSVQCFIQLERRAQEASQEHPRYYGVRYGFVGFFFFFFLPYSVAFRGLLIIDFCYTFTIFITVWCDWGIASAVKKEAAALTVEALRIGRTKL